MPDKNTRSQNDSPQEERKTGRRVRRKGLDLSVLGSGEENTTPSEVIFPPELEKYLSPDLWRKLNTAQPRRSVLVNALRRLDSVQYMLSTYLPRSLVQEKLEKPAPGLVSGAFLKGTLLFADVSGFTALSEQLSSAGQEGAERLTQEMNNYFSRMLEILSWSGGILFKFAGDAMLVYFPEQPGGKQARWAARAGQRMLRMMHKFTQISTPQGGAALQMKIGAASGGFLAASVGTRQRMEYSVLGDAVDRVMTAESACPGPGNMVLDRKTADLLGGAHPLQEISDDLFLLTDESIDSDLGDFEIRPERRRIRGTISMTTSPKEIAAQMNGLLENIEALKPYLAEELVERAAAARASDRRFESEFRLTTVLFCNFTGMEKLLFLWGQSGTRRAVSLLSAYFCDMHTVVKRHGGIISRIDPYNGGSKMLILFGSPVAHEDDPQRAVSAALGMNVALKDFNQRWRKKLARHLSADFGDTLLQHRIGITLGDTFAGQVGSSTRREYTVMGDVVNLAARLMEAAEPGQILASEAAAQAVSQEYGLTPLPPAPVKGMRKPIPRYQVDSVRSNSLPARLKARGKLIGREKELEKAALIMRTSLAGQCELLVLQGPAGIGKSHLADEILRQGKQQGARLLFHQAQAYNEDIPFAAWGALLRSLAGISAQDHPLIQHDKLKHFTTSIELPHIHTQPLAELMGLTPAADDEQGTKQPEITENVESTTMALEDVLRRGRKKRGRGSGPDVLEQLEKKRAASAGQSFQRVTTRMLYEDQKSFQSALLKLFEQLLTASPVLLFFEDAHWMDRRSSDLLVFLMKNLTAKPLFVLMAQRGETELPADLGTRQTLETLNLDETTALVSHILASELAGLIHEQSSGNPLYVEQITGWVKDASAFDAQDLGKALQESDIVQNLVLSSLETLSEDQRETARAASVIGMRFSTDALLNLIESLDAVTLNKHLKALEAANLIMMTSSGVDVQYAFQRALVRDILYNNLPFARRRKLHTSLADYLSSSLSSRRRAQMRLRALLEEETQKDTTRQAETIAHHYRKADKPLAAARYYLKAGQEALSDKDLQRAESAFQEGLSLLAESGNDQKTQELQAHLQTGTGDAALLGKDFPMALKAYQMALAGWPADAPAEQRLQLAYKLALMKTAAGIQVLDENLPAPADPFSAAALAWIHWRAGRIEASEAITHALEMLQDMQDDWSQQVRILLEAMCGNWQTAVNVYLEMQLPACSGFSACTALAAMTMLQLGDHCLAAEEWERAAEWYARAADLQDAQSEERCLQSLMSFRQAEIQWRSGDHNLTLGLLNEVLDLLDGCSPTDRKAGQRAIQQTVDLIQAGKKDPWPVWALQNYQDMLHVLLLWRA